jgi:hypothetical protein
MAQAYAPRFETIEGQRTLVVKRTPPIPPTLDALLGQLRFAVAYDVRPGGTSRQCEVLREHRFQAFREGRHVGTDGIVRDLRLLMCADCSAVCVRDVSIDRLAGLPTGGRGLARRDLVLGWYSGKRRNGRTHL